MMLLSALAFCGTGIWFAITGENYTPIALLIFLVVVIKHMIEDILK